MPIPPKCRPVTGRWDNGPKWSREPVCIWIGLFNMAENMIVLNADRSSRLILWQSLRKCNREPHPADRTTQVEIDSADDPFLAFHL